MNVTVTPQPAWKYLYHDLYLVDRHCPEDCSLRRSFSEASLLRVTSTADFENLFVFHGEVGAHAYAQGIDENGNHTGSGVELLEYVVEDEEAHYGSEEGVGRSPPDLAFRNG